jgi:hypothetical protein
MKMGHDALGIAEKESRSAKHENGPGTVENEFESAKHENGTQRPRYRRK